MAKNNTKDIFKYNNADKQNKNFMYSNLKRSNCYNCNFTGSNFNFVSFRGAHLKSCDFYGCTFKSTEFIGANLKKSKFKYAKFENAIFEGVNLEGTDFKDAEFKNVIFLNTDISKAKNLKGDESDIRVFEEMPQIEMSEELKNAVKVAMENKYIKAARVLDTKDGEINTLMLMILLENFSESILIKGLNRFKIDSDKDFCTLSYVIRTIEKYKNDGLI
ncbi:pentapeptide repeat-containing protein [Clostridium tarantellae]|uniref:Pentapeptide repeat-containing protein n=1 Tax=Clostridium tarantellae TaxID=39493 RepID=A0A6I1MPA0_9CLOT|nr:pentapeptide repeat-containing protein [Clostridium tarantellae]MPQ44760.1 pentapeptide repeat-containing protein [Clostridium tarantellae]